MCGTWVWATNRQGYYKCSSLLPKAPGLHQSSSPMSQPTLSSSHCLLVPNRGADCKHHQADTWHIGTSLSVCTAPLPTVCASLSHEFILHDLAFPAIVDWLWTPIQAGPIRFSWNFLLRDMNIEGEFWVMKMAELTHDHLQTFAAESLELPWVLLSRGLVA